MAKKKKQKSALHTPVNPITIVLVLVLLAGMMFAVAEAGKSQYLGSDASEGRIKELPVPTHRPSGRPLRNGTGRPLPTVIPTRKVVITGFPSRFPTRVPIQIDVSKGVTPSPESPGDPILTE